MQDKTSDKSPKTTELDDAALDSVVGGTSLGPVASGPIYTPIPGGGVQTGGGGGSKPSGADDGSVVSHPSGPFEPNSINFPK
jgi:hypothetical protein